MSSADRSDRILLLFCLLASLVLHAAGLGMAWHFKDRVKPAMTYLVSGSSDEDPEDMPAEQQPEEEEKDEFLPGIENGAPAVVAWIGYDEYQEHLARLAEVEQAAFTMSDGGAQPSSADTAVPPSSGDVSEETSDALAEQPDPEQQPPSEASSFVVAERDPVLEQMLAAQRLDILKLFQVGVDTRSDALESEAENESEAPSAAEEAQVSAESDSKPADAQQEHETTDASEKPGEPHDRNAVPDERESPATSTKEITEAEWKAGQPLAVEGMEILPFALYRHIVIDSGNALFDFRWSRHMERNPVVGLRFNRTGRVASIAVMRKSGYREFDTKYLTTWMSRWRARDERLAQLKPDDMTNQILVRLVFIEEPEDQPASSSSDDSDK